MDKVLQKILYVVSKTFWLENAWYASQLCATVAVQIPPTLDLVIHCIACLYVCMPTCIVLQATTATQHQQPFQTSTPAERTQAARYLCHISLCMCLFSKCPPSLDESLMQLAWREQCCFCDCRQQHVHAKDLSHVSFVVVCRWLLLYAQQCSHRISFPGPHHAGQQTLLPQSVLTGFETWQGEQCTKDSTVVFSCHAESCITARSVSHC